MINGKLDGQLQEKQKIAKKMKDEKIDISIIVKVTGLTQEEIENL